MRRIDKTSSGRDKYKSLNEKFSKCGKYAKKNCHKEAKSIVSKQEGKSVYEMAKDLQERFMVDDESGIGLISMLNGRDATAAIESLAGVPKELRKVSIPESIKKKSENDGYTKSKCIKIARTYKDITSNEKKKASMISAEIQQHHFPKTSHSKILSAVKEAIK